MICRSKDILKKRRKRRRRRKGGLRKPI